MLSWLPERAVKPDKVIRQSGKPLLRNNCGVLSAPGRVNKSDRRGPANHIDNHLGQKVSLIELKDNRKRFDASDRPSKKVIRCYLLLKRHFFFIEAETLE